MTGSASYLILVVPFYLPASCNRQSPPCHPLFWWRGAAGLIGVVGLLAGGVMTPVSAASPSVQSRETRIALLSIFDQLGVGVDHGNDSTRSRANRRHPDVGFISSDPICLSCVMTVLAPPVLPPPPPRQAPPPPVPEPTISSPPLFPSPAPEPQPVAEPLTVLESQLPAVLPPGQDNIVNPLSPQQFPAVLELSPVTIAPMDLPSDSEILLAQAPVQTPGPLPILGLGAAFGVSRRLRGRLKAAQRQRVG
jgi:hypothetical protein